MPGREVQNLKGSTVAEDAIEEFASSLRGALLRPDDDGYEATRIVWNGMIDRSPGLIARCSGVADVISAVNFARVNDLLVAIRGGGHSIPGHSACDGGLMIDLSLMKGVWVDEKARTARAQGGVTWGELDRETQVFGLATPGGVISTTGIAGLTLGGGVGWLVRKHGLSCDNLISVDIVTADGQLLRASADENPDLFWALRGGGGNFGVATSFEFRLHSQGTVMGGLVLHPRAKAKEVLSFFRDFMATAPDELTAYCGLLTAPDGVPVVGIIGCYSGPLEAGEAAMRPLREFGLPVADLIGPIPHTQMQSLLDAGFPYGNQNYWRSTFLNGLSDELFDVLIEHAGRMASPLSALVIEHYGGAESRVGESETAFPHRGLQYDLNIIASWTDPAENEQHIQWARDLSQAAQPFAADGVYVNFLGDEGEDRVRTSFGKNYDRLVEIKKKYDPTNLFRLNQNIKPA